MVKNKEDIKTPIEVRNFESVKIFYKNVEVRYVEDLARDNQLLGQAIHDKNLIKLDWKNQEKENIAILIHEILHISFSTYDKKMDKEETVNSMTNIFCTIMKDNKELFKAIINEI